MEIVIIISAVFLSVGFLIREYSKKNKSEAGGENSGCYPSYNCRDCPDKERK